ncbi:hypothetical protein Bca4012_026564 [Brassica carinata]|uniref:Uncharacterized protein n=1 Tax=Brassica carinata TaxID=52824 RepID=A0A8X7VIS4_BRACI|nr:hypothetical protein Bca52824_023591 [Brassica carinata]
MVRLIEDGTCFNMIMFTGGVTTTDVARMREETKAVAMAKKKRKRKVVPQTGTIYGENIVREAPTVNESIRADLARVEGEVDDVLKSFS